MRKAFFGFVAALLVCISAYAENFDAAADAQILACVHSREFSQVTVDYPFGDYTYPITIIHNPHRERLWVEEVSSPQTWPLGIMADLPFELISHLKDLIPELNTQNPDFYIDLRGYEEVPPELFASLRPVTTYTEIDNSKADAEIKELFSSAGFVNKVFHYRLDNKEYMVRILHNPMGHTFKAVREYRLEIGEKRTRISLSWNHRYGIIVDREAPQALIDHLSTLTNASWRDWYFNFKIENGTSVTYTRSNWSVITTYYLDTWFDYTRDLK